MADDSNQSLPTDDQSALPGVGVAPETITIAGKKPQFTADTKLEEDIRARRAALEGELSKTQAGSEQLQERLQKATGELGTMQEQDAALQKWYLENYPEGDINPPRYQPVTMADMQQNMFPLLLLATIGGMGQRRHYVGALSSFASMLQGAGEGRKEAFEAARTEYQGKMEVLKNRQDQYKRRFDAIMADRKLDLTAKTNQIRQLEMEYGKQLQHEDNIQKAIDRTYAENQAFDKLISTQEMLLARLAAQAAQTDGTTHLAPTTLQYLGWQTLVTGKTPTFGYKGRADQEAIYNEAITIAGELGISPEQFATMPSEFKADASSMLFQTKRLDTLQSILSSFHNNMQTWDEIAKGLPPTAGGRVAEEMRDKWHKIDFSRMKSVNDFRLELGRQINDPQVVAYLASSMAVAMDYARIIAGGGAGSVAMTPEGARQDAERIISAGLDNQARKGLEAALESDANGQIQGVENQVKTIKDRMRGRISKPPEAKPGPEALAWLKSAVEHNPQWSLEDIIAEGKRLGKIPKGATVTPEDANAARQ